MELLYYPHKALETECSPVEAFSGELHTALDEMWDLLDKTEHAMGLAANQVGILKRFFIMRGTDGIRWEFVNPEIKIDEEGGYAFLREGCLSSPELFDMVSSRYESVELKAFDRNGTSVNLVSRGIESVCIQHELDHLNGLFWFDRMPKNHRKAMLRKWEKVRKRYAPTDVAQSEGWW